MSVADQTASLMQCYPNPTAGLLHFTSNCVQVQVLSINGRVLEIHQGNLNSINLSHLSSGMYFIRASDHFDTTNVSKVVVK